MESSLINMKKRVDGKNTPTDKKKQRQKSASQAG